jgi:uncharacterized membrane protein
VVALLILVLSCLIFRGLGFAGISALAAWQPCSRDVLSLMLIFTGISHFTFMKEDFVRMIPPSIPWPRAMVYFTGVCEIAGAIGLLLPEYRRTAAYALIAFFLAVLPANIHAARWRNFSGQACDRPVVPNSVSDALYRNSLVVRALKRQSAKGSARTYGRSNLESSQNIHRFRRRQDH